MLAEQENTKSKVQDASQSAGADAAQTANDQAAMIDQGATP